MIIFNELEYASRLLEEGYIRKSKIKKDLFILCKYYKHIGLSKLQTAKKLFVFINKYNTYVYSELTDKLKKSVLKTISDIYKFNYTFRIGLNISFSRSELLQISQLKTNGERQVLFIMMMLSKFFKTKSGTFYASTKDIIKLTGLFYDSEHSHSILNKLVENGYIGIVSNNKVARWVKNEKIKVYSRINYKINLNSCDDMIYSLRKDDNFNFVEDYAKCMNIVDNEFKYCVVCGEQFISKANYYKYCSDCAEQIERSNWKKRKQKQRNKIKCHEDKNV